MGSKEPIELLLIVGIEIFPIPPEPIAAFGGIEFIPGCLYAIRGKSGSDFGETRSRVTDQIPPPIVLLVADPDLVVLVDPGTGMEVADSSCRRRSFERVRDCRSGGANAVVIECAR